MNDTQDIGKPGAWIIMAEPTDYYEKETVEDGLWLTEDGVSTEVKRLQDLHDAEQAARGLPGNRLTVFHAVFHPFRDGNDPVIVSRRPLEQVLEQTESVQNMTLVCDFCTAVGQKHHLTVPLIHDADCPGVLLLDELNAQSDNAPPIPPTNDKHKEGPA